MKVGECHLGFVGFGHMGQIIFKALDAARLIPRSQILFHRRDPAKAKKSQKECGITSTSLSHLLEQSNLLLICVRPNQALLALQELAKMGVDSKMIISVMAGIKIAFLQKILGSKAQVVRIMPNIASSVGEGMSLFAWDSHSTVEFRSITNLLFASLGQVAEITESQMDIGCAMAGSGPAFVIELIEAMARLGEREGIAYSKGLQIAAQTFTGAAALIRQGAIPQDLLMQIATPEGTTAAGLHVLRDLALSHHFQAVLLAAATRSKQISEE